MARGTFTGANEVAGSRKIGDKASSPEFGHGLLDKELKLISEGDLNRRQTKNAVRTASALAASEGEVLGYRRSENVLDMTADFEVETRASRNESM